MSAKELLGAGKVRDAESALNAYLRDNPADADLLPRSVLRLWAVEH